MFAIKKTNTRRGPDNVGNVIKVIAVIVFNSTVEKHLFDKMYMILSNTPTTTFVK